MSADRADRIAERLASRELDALLVTDLVNVRWLTGFTGSNGLALVGAGGYPFRLFITDFRYLTQSEEQLGDAWERQIASDILAHAADCLREAQRGRPLHVGYDDVHLSVKAHAALVERVGEDVELIPAGGLIEELRAVKDDEELERIRAAAKLADEALSEVLERGIVGRTERDVALELEIAMRRRGASGPSFPPIVASGAHAALPHAEPRDVTIPSGTLVTIDWGAQLDGYASDCTRTVATGEVGDEERAVYALVREAQQKALAAVRAGVAGRDVDAVAREIIKLAGHGEHFGHGLGHGVGAVVHEAPRLSQQSEDVLQAGNVVTVEPGVYVPGLVGVRIEDLVIVREDGPEVLTSLPKELVTVG